ncbi:MAG: hypothetical protein ACP5OU_08240 [Methanothrix sp.]
MSTPGRPRPIVGIARVMKEEIGDLIQRARFEGMPEKVTVEGGGLLGKRI